MKLLLALVPFNIPLNCFFTVIKHTKNDLQQKSNFFAFEAEFIQIFFISEFVEIVSF